MDEKDKLIQELRRWVDELEEKVDKAEDFYNWLRYEAFGADQMDVVEEAYKEDREKKKVS